MQRITASAFKAKCLQLLDDVAATGEPLIITKHGQPICQLVPYRLKPKTLYGALHGSKMITGNDRILTWSSALRRHDARQ